MDERTDPAFGTTNPSVNEPSTQTLGTESQSQTEQASTAAKEQAKEVAGSAAEAARGVAAEAGQQARQVASEASRQARGIADQTRQQARQQADNQTRRAAQTLHTLSDQMRALAEGRQDESGDARKYIEWFADRAGDMARHLETRGIDGLVSDVKSFARRRPGLFLAGSAAAGFVVSRIAKSARGSQAEQDQFTPSAPPAHGLPAPPTIPQQDAARIGDIPAPPLPVPAGIDPTVVPTDVDPTVVESSEATRSGVGVTDQDETRGGM
jgi:hypothetical protein